MNILSVYSMSKFKYFQLPPTILYYCIIWFSNTQWVKAGTFNTASKGQTLKVYINIDVYLISTSNSIQHHIFLYSVDSSWWSHFKIRGVISKYLLVNPGVGSKYFQMTLESLENILKGPWTHFSMGVTWKCYTCEVILRDHNTPPMAPFTNMV